MDENTKIISVDGFKIRNTLDDNFGIIHTHYSGLNYYIPKFYIPIGERWVDYPYIDEVTYLIEVDRFTDPDGVHNYEEKRGQAIEKFISKEPPPPFVKHQEESGELMIKHVDGGVVRKYFDPEFILGGHDLVYAYIPKGEIWLDAKMNPLELPFILHHEMIERDLMTKGKPYEIAHEYAIVSDMEKRRNEAGAFYPGDPKYPWETLSHDEIIKSHYVVNS